jgi:hypothetical protein
MKNLVFVCGVLVMAGACTTRAGTLVTPEELVRRDAWVKASFEPPASAPAQPGLGSGVPFSFRYGGRPSAELLPAWERKDHTQKLDEERTKRTVTWTDQQTGLELRCVVVEYGAFPTVEWTLYYPLTRWSAEPDTWIAWQFDRPEDGKGVVQAFRRPQSLYETARFKMRGLEPEARYMLKNFDTADTTDATGKELLEQGLAIAIPEPPGAVIITYSRKDK